LLKNVCQAIGRCAGGAAATVPLRWVVQAFDNRGGGGALRCVIIREIITASCQDAAKQSNGKFRPRIQPKPEDCAFDLDRALGAVLGLHATVPEDAFTAGTLGNGAGRQRRLIRKDGLVLTIGYLITEAESLWLTSSVGGAVPGHVLGYDQETGFGLVQALGRLSVSPIEPAANCGSAPATARSSRRRRRRQRDRRDRVARQEFAGHWEYLLDRAISPRRLIHFGAVPR